MEDSQSAGLAKSENLRTKLEAGERSAFGSKLPIGIERKRELLIRAISNKRRGSLQIGQLAAKYRDEYKAEQSWMPLGESIALALGYKSYTSLNQLMKTAVRASKIPKNLLAAVTEEGIDPAENKYRSLVDELIKLDFSGTDDDAIGVAREALATFNARKKALAKKRREARNAAATQVEFRIAKQVTICLEKTTPPKRAAQADAILRQLAAAIRAVLPEYNVRGMFVENDGAAQSSDSGVPAVRSSRAKITAMPTQYAAKPSLGKAIIGSTPEPEVSSQLGLFPSRKAYSRPQSDDPSPARRRSNPGKKKVKTAEMNMPTLFDMPIAAGESSPGKR